MAKSGLSLNRCEAVPLLTTSYHWNTYVHGLARIIHGFVTEQDRIPRDEADAWLAEFDDLEANRAFFFGVSRYVFLAEHS
ncbi:hypothetical protein BH18ACT5_BH18ACT5_11770 [soil metagenome]